MENSKRSEETETQVGEGLVPSQKAQGLVHPATPNGASAPEDIQAIKAQLEEEKKARAALEKAAAERDARLAQLQAEGEALRAERSNLQTALSEAKQGSETLKQVQGELTTTKAARDQAVAKYLTTARALNPTIPTDLIAGATIEEIDASVEKALAIAESVRKSLEAEASRSKVPAGAPTRGTINLEGMSPREKIAYGIQQKGA